MSNTQHITEAVETIISTRDFCGDEKAALRSVESDRHIRFTEAEKQEIWSKVNGTWKESQVAAGANILTPHERKQACAALEDDWGDPDECKNWTPENSRRLRMNHERNSRNFEQ